eukprot:SAG31_NODE_496_length_14862_cov_9.280837_6_plen_192_part_00
MQGPRPRVFDPAAHGWVFKETEARPDHGIDGDYWRLTIEHPDGSTDSNSGQCTVPYIRGCGTVQHIKGGTTYVCHSYFLHSDDAKRVSLYHVLKGHPKDDNGASKIMRGTLGGRVDKETDRRAKRQRKARVLPPGFVDTLDPSLSFAMSKSLKGDQNRNPERSCWTVQDCYCLCAHSDDCCCVKTNIFFCW